MALNKTGPDSKKAKSLSLVAQYDDIVRHATLLCRGDEEEFINILKRQDAARKLWLAMKEEHEQCQNNLSQMEHDNLSLGTQLKHARNQIEVELERRKKAEKDRDSLERQVGLIRELLVDKKDNSIMCDIDRERLIPVLNSTLQSPGTGTSVSPNKRTLGSVETNAGPGMLHLGQGGAPPSRYVAGRQLDTINESGNSILDDDISFDKTEEDLDALPQHDDHCIPFNVTTRRTRSSGRKSGRKSNKRPSAPSQDDVENKVMKSEDAVPKEAPTLQTPTSTGPTKNTGDFIVDCTTATPVISSRRSATILRTPSTSILSPGKGLNHPHTFVEKTIVRMESCIPCGKRITFGKTASKCRDCKSICHLECRHLVPVPCIATTTQTPRGADKGALADYAPTERPQVPGIVVHCVNEVEARGLTEPGIYRVPGSDAMVKELLQRFLKGKGTPNLSRIEDINVICSLLKHFLRQLKEPVTTYGLWSSFIKAAENYRLGNLSQAVILVQETVARLPPPNRDTLAFLLLHLIRVAETKVTKMPVHNLAKVFGPTIIGYSSPEPEALQMLNEPRMQADVLELLMAGMGPAFWEGIVRADDPSWMSFNASNAETFNNTTLQSVRGNSVAPPSYETVNKTPRRQRSLKGDGGPVYLKVHSASPVFQ